MPRRHLASRRVCVLATVPFLLALTGLHAIEITGTIIDATSSEPIAARLSVAGADGTWFFATSASPAGSAVRYDKQRGTSVERHTTLSAHPFRVELPAGTYTLVAERGKEYLTARKKVAVGEDPIRVTIRLERWIDMAARGWYSGETHVHRRLEDLPNIMRAEELNVAFPLTYWVTRAYEPPRTAGANPIAGTRHAAGTLRDEGRWIRLDPKTAIYPRNTEYEIFTVGGKRHTLGAFFVIRHRRIFEKGVPPIAPVLEVAREDGALIELDKHNWPWSMAIVPLMKVDLYELTNNHIWRTDFHFKGWGERAADYMRVEAGTERGWIDFGFQNYYALLNCGYRLRPTAGTASGVHPVPLGFGRVYVELPDGFEPEAWLRGLDAGRSFVTTGPMLLVKVDGKPAGHRLVEDTAAPRDARVHGECLSPWPLESVEVILNGSVATTIDAEQRRTDQGAYAMDIDTTLRIEGSSWIAVRAFAKLPNERRRFAHSSPCFIDMPGKPLRPRRDEVEFLARRVREQIERSKDVLPDAAIDEYRRSLAAFEKLGETARQD